MKREIWISKNDVVDLSGKTQQAISLWIKDGKVTSRESEKSTGGRKGYEILLSSLPLEIREAWDRKVIESTTQRFNDVAGIRSGDRDGQPQGVAPTVESTEDEAAFGRAMSRASEAVRNRVNRWLRIFAAFENSAVTRRHKNQPEVIAWCKAWSSAHPDEKEVTASTLCNQLSLFKKKGKLGFLEGFANVGSAKKISAKPYTLELALFYAAYMVNMGVSINEAAKFTKGQLIVWRDQARSDYELFTLRFSREISEFDSAVFDAKKYRLNDEAIKRRNGKDGQPRGASPTVDELVEMVEEFPSGETLYRKLVQAVGKSAVYMAREGFDAHKRKYGSYVQKSSKGLFPNGFWIGDAMQYDVRVLFEDGTIGRPWLSAWLDYRSHRFVSWEIHKEAQNSDHNFLTMYRGIKEWGKPKGIVIDNGKTYRNGDFAGGRPNAKATKRQIGKSEDEAGASGLHSKAGALERDSKGFVMRGLDGGDVRKMQNFMATLAVEVHFAIPYRSQAKAIERMFGELHKKFCRWYSTYVGTGPGKRTESYQTAEKQGNVIKFDEFVKLFEKWVNEVFHVEAFKSGERKGESPNSLWESGYGEAVKSGDVVFFEEDDLIYMCTRVSKPIRIGRNGVTDSTLGVTYWGEWMQARKGEKVYLRRDPKQYRKAWCYDLNDVLIGKATMNDTVMAIVSTADDRATLTKEINRWKSDEKKTKELAGKGVRTIPVAKVMEARAAYAKHEAEKAGLPLTVTAIPENQRVKQVTKAGLDLVKMRKMQAEGNHDISQLVKKPERREKPIFFCEADKKRWEEEEARKAK